MAKDRLAEQAKQELYDAQKPFAREHMLARSTFQKDLMAPMDYRAEADHPDELTEVESVEDIWQQIGTFNKKWCADNTNM